MAAAAQPSYPVGEVDDRPVIEFDDEADVDEEVAGRPDRRDACRRTQSIDLTRRAKQG